jgi:uncharacterized membrane protein YuzA (DUF378 family)
MAKAGSFEWIAWIIVTIGAINWGLVGFFDFNLITKILGEGSMGATIVYDIVGLLGLYAAYLLYTYSKKKMK